MKKIKKSSKQTRIAAVLKQLPCHTLNALLAGFTFLLPFPAAAAQSWTSQITTTQSVQSASITQSKPPFLVRSQLGSALGKCLDYGIRPGAPAGAAPSVFLNLCSQAHPIVVEELNDGRHDVVLHAGNSIIGMPRPLVVSFPFPSTFATTAAAATTTITAATATAATTKATAAATAISWFQPNTELALFSPSATLSTQADYVFALDGDSIILADSRCPNPSQNCTAPPTQQVVQLEAARSDIGTPLMVGPRNLADTEFWDFVATDESNADPTSGFMTVSDRNTLLIAMYEVNQIAVQNGGAAWGSVIRILDTGEPIDLTPNPASVDPGGITSVNAIHNLVVPTGVTIRGDRRGTNPGPLLFAQYNDPSEPNPGDRLMQVEGDYVRITGLRIQGPSGNEDTMADSTGIFIGDPLVSRHQPIETLIDHNEVFDWPLSAIQPFAGSDDDQCANGKPGSFDPNTGEFKQGPIASVTAARVERNFIHHTAEQGLGYGVVLSSGAGATIFGNTFLDNRHAIAADGKTGDQYSAWDNLVLSDAPKYCGVWSCKAEQDFDMHGTLSIDDQQHDGGWAGFHLDIAWNTFFGDSHPILALRGQSCHQPDTFRNNVSLEYPGEAFLQWDYSGNKSQPTSSTSELTIQNNAFAADDPTYQFGVGDFDGDGRQDLFLATGTTWFYSPGGATEWRYLNAGKTDRLQSLLLGDFDGDGRTDVVGINGTHLMISWGGVSDWAVFNTAPSGASIQDMAVGDFDADGHADILYADGANWFISYGGSTPFKFVNTSSWRVNNLRFGHFSVCGSRGETDAFGIVTGKWQVTCGGLQDWVPLPVSLGLSLTNLYVGDFDGDGYADIAFASNPQYDGEGRLVSWKWRFSHDAAESFVDHEVTTTDSCSYLAPHSFSSPPLVAGVGRFAASSNADILVWGADSDGPNKLCILPSGTGDALMQSRQSMR